MPRNTAAPDDTEVAPYTGTMLDAMDVAGMVGPSFDAWRTVWRAVFALPMDATDLERYRFHTGRKTPPPEPVSELWLPIGGRGGKSRNVAVAGVFLAVRRDYRALLAPGERAIIPIIASDRDQAGQVLRYVKGITSTAFREWVVGKPLSSSVEFSTGVVIEVATASYRTIRGYTIVALIGDEIAFWRDENSADPDAEILNAARPRMKMVPGNMLFALSSPYARKGELYKMVSRHYGRDNPRILVWNSDTRSMNPSYPQEEIDRAFEDDPAVAGSELGQDGHVVFRSDVEAFVSQEAVAAAVVTGRHEIPPAPDRRYFAFTDPSGGSQDSWTLSLAHIDDAQLVLDAVRETRPPFSPASVVADHATLLTSYGVREVEGDHYGGEFPRELYRKHGITYRPSEMPKSDIYKEWLPLLNGGRLELLDHPRLRAQFCGLERKVARSGQDSIDHAPGGHDDIANASAGALVRASRKRHVEVVRFAL
jgi:hypothetical protein